MLSWLQVKLNILTLSCVCSLFMHSMIILTLMFCGSYTQLKLAQAYTSTTNVLSGAKQFAPVRLGTVPPHKAQISTASESFVQNIPVVNAPEVLVEQQAPIPSAQVQAEKHVTKTEIDKTVAQESKPVPVQERKQKQVQKTAAQTDKKSVVQNKKAASAKSTTNTSTSKQATKQTNKQVPVPGQFSPLKKEHTKLLRSKERQKPRMQAKKEPIKKPEQKLTAPISETIQKTQNSDSEPAKSTIQDVSVQEHVTPVTNTQTSSVPAPVPTASVVSMDQPGQAVHTGAVIQFISGTTSASPEQQKAYDSVADKIYTRYSKPPGFDSSAPFTLTFKVGYVTGKAHDISPRPEQVPLLVYQSAKASISEIVYPQELWGYELNIPFN